MRPVVRADIATSEPYGAPIAAVPAKLNVNENPYPPSPAVVQMMAQAVADVLRGANRYPDREAGRLRAALAEYATAVAQTQITPDQVWAANGSNEVMQHLFAAFGGPGRSALSFGPSYSMYPEYARESFTTYRTIPRRSDFTLDLPEALRAISQQQPSIVLVASPNNPTGNAATASELRSLTAAVEDIGGLLIVDEAYGEFLGDQTPSAMCLVNDSPNVAVTRTLSKAFGLAGLRLGYCVASAEIVDGLRIVRLPYHLSAVTQAVAVVAVESADKLLSQVASLREQRKVLERWAGSVGLQQTDSQANFVYLGRFADRAQVWQQCLDAGVLVRQSGPDGWLRVSVGTPAENDRFMTVMSQIVSRGDVLNEG